MRQNTLAAGAPRRIPLGSLQRPRSFAEFGGGREVRESKGKKGKEEKGGDELEVSLNDMRYINSRFTYFTYLRREGGMERSGL